eukprot:TRINITY_DN15739_c0_g1_i1.p1 TRINITY_DN15739_c0_g1~~TRINITY_DN15739_c0_g1_i1.p1  ORF type:complete len:309 (-),score=79.12 TRINITY_DN15739_c0_g1_i1:405-1277(-)
MEVQSQETTSSKFEAIVDDILATKAAQVNDIQEQDDDTEEPIFKTRGRSSAKNLRKRKREDENASKPEDEVDPEVLKKLEETREYQQLRERKHGYDMSASAVGYSTSRKRREDEVIGRLDENFTVHNEAKPLFDRRMEEFIEQQMKARKEMIAKGIDPGASAESKSAGVAEEPQQAALRVPKKSDNTVANSSTLSSEPRADSERQRSGPKWATTVVEVELPSTYRMQAIKETEQMLKKLQEDASKPAAPEEAPTEYAVNFAKVHQGPVSYNGRATDDLVYEKFKKRFANR